MPPAPTKIAYLTAGAAGMYCGSCMHDNTLARGLTQLGLDVQLIPTYTPIRTDEENVSVDRVFFGGISVYLQQKFRWYRHLSPLAAPLVDQPWLIKMAAGWGSSTNPKMLGALTVSMLRGEHGRQRNEVRKLCRWLADTVQPDIVQFSNILIGGCIPAIKSQLRRPVVVTLQGDDIFLESLPEPYRSQAIAEIQKLVGSIDGFLVHSRYYADFTADYFQIPADKIHLVPLGIDTAGIALGGRPEALSRPPTIGYLARLAPEKGFHLLVDAFLELRRRDGFADAQLRAAGWLDPQKQPYLDAQRDKLREAGCETAFEYVGSVDRPAKFAFLRQIDVLSVPTTYRDPKGLFVLEALAAGVPVVQPAHGAFPELVGGLGGGRLVEPDNSSALAAALAELLLDPESRRSLAAHGQQQVLANHSATAAAQATWEKLQQFLP